MIRGSKSKKGVSGIFFCMDCNSNFHAAHTLIGCTDWGNGREDTVPIYVEDSPEVATFIAKSDYLGG